MRRSHLLWSRYQPACLASLLLVVLALLCLLLSSCASTAPQLAAQPPVPTIDLKAPAECTKAAFRAFASELSGLPTNYATMSDEGQAKTLLANKNADTDGYQRLRAQAVRCAPES